MSGEVIADIADFSRRNHRPVHLGPVGPGLPENHGRQGREGSAGTDPGFRQVQTGKVPQMVIQNLRRGNLNRLHIFLPVDP